MNSDSTSAKEKKFAELKSSLHSHDELYYRKARPEISDQEYDRLKREFDQLQAELDPLGLFTEETDQSGQFRLEHRVPRQISHSGISRRPSDSLVSMRRTI